MSDKGGKGGGMEGRKYGKVYILGDSSLTRPFIGLFVGVITW